MNEVHSLSTCRASVKEDPDSQVKYSKLQSREVSYQILCCNMSQFEKVQRVFIVILAYHGNRE